jgi:hypothetical protein
MKNSDMVEVKLICCDVMWEGREEWRKRVEGEGRRRRRKRESLESKIGSNSRNYCAGVDLPSHQPPYKCSPAVLFPPPDMPSLALALWFSLPFVCLPQLHIHSVFPSIPCVTTKLSSKFTHILSLTTPMHHLFTPLLTPLIARCVVCWCVVVCVGVVCWCGVLVWCVGVVC